MKTKTVILATDISGLGKVAATAALPLFAICQLEVALLPTMILSSHTGGFSNIYIDDYTHGMLAFLKQWQNLEFDFSALVTGYLKSDIQVENLLRFKEEKSLPLIVDPIMGDKGTFLSGIFRCPSRPYASPLPTCRFGSAQFDGSLYVVRRTLRREFIRR